MNAEPMNVGPLSAAPVNAAPAGAGPAGAAIRRHGARAGLLATALVLAQPALARDPAPPAAAAAPSSVTAPATKVAPAAATAAADAPRETVVPAFSHPIAGVPGKNLSALIVTYPPGGKTPAHRHGRAFVVGYVLEGSIRSRLGDGTVKVYKAGESWTEQPGAHHTVSENASATEPARLMAIFVAGSRSKDLFTVDGAR